MKRTASLLTGMGLLVVGAVMFVSVGMGVPRAARSAQAAEGSDSVYVCACMKTSSCPCASMSNKAGKCPCGSDEMKAVPRKGKWAAANRKSLSGAGK